MSKEERIATGATATPERYLRVAAILLLAASVVTLGFSLVQLFSRQWMSALGAGLACVGIILAGGSLSAVANARRRLRQLRELHDHIDALSTELAEIKTKMEGGKGE